MSARRHEKASMPGVTAMLAVCLTLGTTAAPVAGPPLAARAREDSATRGSAASGMIVGRVTKEGKPYAYANVIVLGTRMGTQTNEHLAPECFRPNPYERRRVGWPCLVHPWCALALDTVRIAYGYQLARPGFSDLKRHSFPNAAMSWDGGCVVGPAVFTEVAFCGDCRRALERWHQKQRSRR